MEAKDLRTESTLSERSNDGKYGPSGTSIQCTTSKTYQNIGSSLSSKVESPAARPCAVIGPDRVVPPPVSDACLRKASIEPWPFVGNGYRRPPEYPNKIAEYQNQTRNISPRQTYQENMQRIMVPPTYSSIKGNEDFNQISDRSGSLPSKHSIKLNVAPDNKYCEVPYTVNNTVNDQKSIRNPEMCMSSVNPQFPQPVPQGWTPECFSVRTPRGYGAPDLYQYPEYSSCAGPRPVPISRPHRAVQEDTGYVYPDQYYQDANIRFKPYPNVKDRYTQPRYEYIGNYSSPFYPAPVPPHKYDINKSLSTHPYPAYTPLKGLESRASEPIMDGYHRIIPPGNYNVPFRNPVIHPPYGSIIANCAQGKMPPYLSDNTPKIPASNKPPYDTNGNVYIEYENSRLKTYPTSDNLYSNEMRVHSVNNQISTPNYPSINLHSIPPHPYYKKDSLPIKGYEYVNNLRNMDPLSNVMNPISRHLPHFSPGAIPISPTNSNASNDTTHTQSTLHEDCGYVSQSSGTSVKSLDSGIYRNNEYYRRYYDPRYRPLVRTSPMMPKQDNQSGSLGSKDKKQIDVRQFLQMWNEGDDENGENNTSKEGTVLPTSGSHNLSKPHDSGNNNEQLYVLGLVNVPSEELSKYEHIQTVSKLPENIKGYNSIELLNQFEEVIQSSNMNYYKASSHKENKMIIKQNLSRNTPVLFSRPLSPLDVEAKISQSVIHKEVGCNFEIKPCSPKMLNVELATPVQNILSERAIEKVTNPLSTVVTSKSPMNKLDENMDTCNIMKNQNHALLEERIKTPSCKMVNAQYSDSVESLKTNYSLQDLESNSGVCLASLPRLDNDIELNFPEVNQQFINANKNESINMHSVVNELPQLAVTGREVIVESKNTEFIVQTLSTEHEKQVPKLSKFRKNKSTGLEVHNENNQSKIIRTDSVIIKNPENIKNLEETVEHFPVTKLLNGNQLSPMNLTSHCDKIEIAQCGESLSNLETAKNEGDNDNEDKNSSGEIAIDFSFAKNIDSNYSQLNKVSADDFPVKNIESTPKINYEQHVLITDKNQDATFFKEFCEEEESSCTTSTIKNAIITLKIEEHKVYSDNSVNIIAVERDTSSDKKRKITTHDAVSNFKVATKGQAPVPEKCNSIKSEDNYSISENFINLKEKFDQVAHIQVSDILSSDQEVCYKLQNINSEDDGEKCTDIEDNDSKVERDNLKKYVLIEKSIDKAEINKNSETFNSLLEDSEKILISELVGTDIEDNTKSSDINESIGEGAAPKNFNTMLFEHQPKSELKGPKIEDEDIQCDDIESSKVNQRTDSEVSEKEIIPKLLETNFKDNDVKHSTMNDDVSQHEILEVSYTVNTEQKPVSEIKIISTGVENEHCNDLIDTNYHSIFPVVSSPLKSDQEMVFELQQIEIKDQGDEFSAIKESLHEIEISVHSADVLELDQEVKSEQQQIGIEDQGEQSTDKEKHLHQIENHEVTSAIKFVNVVSELEELITKNDDLNCSKNDINFHRSEKNLNEPKAGYLENKDNSEDKKAISINNTDNEDHFMEQNILLMGVKKCSTEINENDKDHIDNITEFSDLNNYYNTNGIHDDKVLSISDHVLRDEIVNIEKTENGACDLDKPLNKSALQEKVILTNDTTFSTAAVLQNNEYLSNSDKSDEINIQKLANQNKISNSLKSSASDNRTSVNFEENIDQVIENKNDSSHNDTLKIITSNENIINVPCNYNFTREILFRKNLYSPYIQKLLTFSEGRCDNYNKILKSSFIDDYFQRTGIMSECGNSSFQTKNTVTEVQDCNDYNRKTSKEIDIIESSRLVDYDSSDYSLSPCASSDFDNNSKLEQNADYEEKLKESSDIQDIEVNKSQHTPEIDYDNGHEYINTSKNINKKLTSVISENERDNVLNTDFKDDDSKLIDMNNTNVLEAVKEAHEENKVEKTVSNDMICQLAEVPRHNLKRSLSDSALYNLNEDLKDKSDDIPYTCSFKRKKLNDNIKKSNVVAENLCNVLNSNRRNSISSIYTEDSVSFCILIDNDCIITEEDNDSKICYTEISESIFEDIPNNSIIDTHSIMEIIPSQDQGDNICEYSDSYVMECDQEKSPEPSWVDDVACVETVVSDDVAEDIVISATSPDYTSDYEELEAFCSNANDHTDKVKHIYGDKLCQNDAELVETLYNTPQMDVNKTLIHRESQGSDDCDRYYDRKSLERVLSKTNNKEESPLALNYNETLFRPFSPHDRVNFPSPQCLQGYKSSINNHERVQDEVINTKMEQKTQDDTVHSCESSIDNVFSYSHHNDSNDRLTSSSPEVSSTTSDEKSSSILLKITNFKGSIVSQISEYSEIMSKKSCLTDKNDAFNSNDKLHSKKPLITKAAQKYIPPLKETIHDLKVKISLPQDSLKKFKQMKIIKEELKQTPHNPITSNIPKKAKPKFEDVLKSIDEIQFKMHKEKSKKSKKSIPKVVIKKNLNGSHYASTKNKETFNPDLTGRKWQPWVFIEKNSFVDKMANKKKTKAIFSHRKNTFVLAEKFYKYKSIDSTTFVITQPTYSKPSSGQLKYTIRLKHSY